MIVLRKIKTPAPRTVVAEPLQGSLDGANKVFRTPHAYISGKITVHYNGQALHSPDDFIETAADEITFTYFAPHSEDAIPKATYEMSV